MFEDFSGFGYQTLETGLEKIARSARKMMKDKINAQKAHAVKRNKAALDVARSASGGRTPLSEIIPAEMLTPNGKKINALNTLGFRTDIMEPGLLEAAADGKVSGKALANAVKRNKKALPKGVVESLSNVGKTIGNKPTENAGLLRQIAQYQRDVQRYAKENKGLLSDLDGLNSRNSFLNKLLAGKDAELATAAKAQAELKRRLGFVRDNLEIYKNGYGRMSNLAAKLEATGKSAAGRALRNASRFKALTPKVRNLARLVKFGIPGAAIAGLGGGALLGATLLGGGKTAEA